MLLLADVAQAGSIGRMTAAATALAEACWPGGLTVVVPQRDDVPLPANRSGFPEGRDAHEILDQLGDAVQLVLDGGAAHGGPPSTVVDCSGERAVILRAGAIPADRIAAILDAAGAPHSIG